MKKTVHWLISLSIVILGSVIAGLSLEFFLVPNQILDGGVVGISIILAHLTGTKLGIFLVVINIPFLYLSYKQLGMETAIKFFVGVIGLSVSTTFFHHYDPFTEDLLLATVFGGLMLGLGIGIVMKLGGALDGAEIFSLFINEKTGKPVAQVLLVINILIFAGAGFIFGWEQAMYSVLAFYIASKVIDIVMEGLDGMKNVWIVSEHNEKIAERLTEELGRGVTFFKGEGAYLRKEQYIIFCVITRMEETKAKEIIKSIDPNAFVTIAHVAEVKGAQFKTKKH